MRNLRLEETEGVAGSDADGGGGVYFTPDGVPIISPGLVGPPERMPVIPFFPGWPGG